VQLTLTTADLRHALQSMPPLRFGRSVPRLPVIHVDDSVRYQRIAGFGGAMTDTSAWLLYVELVPSLRATVMRELFGQTGIHLSFVRIPMGASDFSATGVPYSYDDLPTGQSDPQLATFSIRHDRAYIIPALKAMLRIDPAIQTLANPWSPPPWMKANGAFDNSLNRGWLLPFAYQPLADYFVKFIQAYARQGVPIDAVTPQNEPLGGSPFPGMQLTEPAEERFVAGYLAPALAAAGLHPKIYGLDSGGPLPYSQALLTGPARSALAGIAWHCYGGIAPMSALEQSDPGVDQILSECSPGIIPYAPVEVAIDGTRNWASVVALWNLALDPAGGPVQPKNWGCRGCTGMITISERTHRARLGRSYYQFGQVSKFVQPGAVRVASDRLVSDYRIGPGNYGVTPGLDDVAFLNPDGTRVLVVFNNSTAARRFAIVWRGRSFSYGLPSRATATFTWRTAGTA
jgi:O-glycosyl hydrolase